MMKTNWKWIAPICAIMALAACAPAEPSLAPPAQTPESSLSPAETAVPPSATPVPVQPTETQSPAFTATPTRLELEIVPATPTKTLPNVETVPMPQDPPAIPPTDPFALELIDRAKSDLAQRTGIPKEEIVLDQFSYVTWPNAALGCPKPGMAYADVLVDGYLIMLRAGLGIYNYHGGGYPDSGPFLCEGGIGTKIIVPPPAGLGDT